MIVRELPTTCFGESLKSGVLRIAEYCMVESLCLLVIFTLTCMCDIIRDTDESPYFDLIPVVLFIFSLVKVFANLLLNKGAIQGRSDFLRFWVYVYGINTAVMMILMLMTGVTMAVLFPPWVNAYIAGAQCMLFILYCGAYLCRPHNVKFSQSLFKYLCQVVYAHKCQLEMNRDSMLRPVINEQHLV